MIHPSRFLRIAAALGFCVAGRMPAQAGARASAPPAAPVAPRLSEMTASRMLLLPAQEVAGVADTRQWLARFDSVLTSKLVAGGIGSGWAYPRDAVRYARNNPTYVSDPHAMGTQLLKSDAADKGFSLFEPFASRLRTILAVADARDAIVPVVATLDTVAQPATAKMKLVFVDGRGSKLIASIILDVKYAGQASAAADSLASAVARLFVLQ